MPRIKKHEMELKCITFTLSITWSECDVDVVLANSSSMVPWKKKVETSSTPTESSVSRYLDLLFQISFKTNEFGKAKVKETYPLMMGYCHVMFEVDMSEAKFEELPAIIENCKRVMRRHMNRIGYYKKHTVTGQSMGLACVGR